MYLYIDPGTGSMLFTILLAILGSLVYLLRNVKVRLGTLLSRNRSAEKTEGAAPLVIYAEEKRYWTTFEPICRELERRGQETVYLTASENDPVFGQGFQRIHPEIIGKGNKAWSRLNFLKAKVVLSTTPSLDVYQWKRSRDVEWYVHVLHAPSDVTMYRMFGVDYYDAVLLSGAYQMEQIRQLEKLRNLPEKELRLVGMPSLDRLKEKLASAAPVEKTDRTVLLAPSWGESGILSRFGEKMIEALLQTGYHIIVRPHPQSFESEKELLDALRGKYPDSDRLEWNRDTDNFEALRRSDILISDFSGVIFEYTLVFDKPILYADTSFDKGPYDCWWLEEELWTFRILPELGMQLTAENLPRLKEMIDECIENPAYQEGREKARRETWACEGESARRIVDYLTEKLAEGGGAEGVGSD